LRNFHTRGRADTGNAQRVTSPKFNHNSTIKRSMAEKFSCFPTIDEEAADKFTDTEETKSEISTEETEFENHLQGICRITTDKKNPFAAWRPFIPQPQEPVFQNSPAQPWWSVSSPPECSSQEPTLATISSIDCLTSKEAIKPIPLQVHPEQTNHQMKPTSQYTWELYKPTTRCYRHSWSRRWPELSGTSKRTRLLRNESPDHQEQSKSSRLWKRRLPFSDKTSLSQYMMYQNTPPETDAGNAHQLSTQCPSRTCSSTTFRINTTRTKSWGTKWRKLSDRIPNWHSKFPALMRPPQRSSRKTPSFGHQDRGHVHVSQT